MQQLGRTGEANFFDLFDNPIIVNGLIKAALLLLFFLVCALFLTALFSHRVFGALIPIKRKLEAMISGEYSDKLVLRRNDELHDLAEAINQLSDKLHDSQAKSPKKYV